jgi:hypothetical protein
LAVQGRETPASASLLDAPRGDCGQRGGRATNLAVTDRCQRDGKITDTRSDLVGVTGFEPAAPRSQSECATKLRHTP